jgi:hypothetical protein
VRSLPRALAFALIMVVAAGTTTRAVAPPDGRAHGTVADASGGVLPGVTVVAVAEDGRVLATTVTDRVGRYAFDALPAASLRLTFQLEGFSTATVEVTVGPNADVPVASQRLALAPRSEVVVVEGKTAAVVVPLAPRPPLPPPPPPPDVIPVPDHDRDSICGPARAGGATSLGTIVSKRHAGGKGLFTMGDELLIDGGTASGLTAGQNVVARRTYRVSGDAGGATGEHTAGLVQIVEAGERASVAVVIYACDEMLRGDWLAPFTPEPVHAIEPAGAPAYDRAARILFGDIGQTVGVTGRLMVIDRGRSGGLRTGQRLTLFRRDRSDGRAPAVVGDAVVVAVRADSATIRVERATDIVAYGDWAAPQQPAAAARR